MPTDCRVSKLGKEGVFSGIRYIFPTRAFPIFSLLPKMVLSDCADKRNGIRQAAKRNTGGVFSRRRQEHTGFLNKDNIPGFFILKNKVQEAEVKLGRTRMNLKIFPKFRMRHVPESPGAMADKDYLYRTKMNLVHFQNLVRGISL